MSPIDFRMNCVKDAEMFEAFFLSCDDDDDDCVVWNFREHFVWLFLELFQVAFSIEFQEERSEKL